MRSSQEEKKPHFFKFFLPGVTDQFIHIPQAFLKNIDDGSLGTVSLMGPSGNVWHVDLVANVNGLFFQDGWNEFVRDHFLEVGYFLIFRYDGNLRFTVQIFDTSGCEKSNSFYAKCCQESSGFEEDKGNDKVKEGAAEALIVSPCKDYEDVSSGRSGEHNQITIEDSEDEKPIELGKRSTVRMSCKSGSTCNQITLEDSEDEKPIESSKRSPMRISCKSGSNYLTVDDKQSAQGFVHEKPISSKRYMTRSSYTVECNQLSVRRSLIKKPASSAKRRMKDSPQQVHSSCSTICNKKAARRSYSLREKPISSPKRSVIQDSRQLRSGGSTKNKQLAVQRPLFKKPRSSTKNSRKCQRYHSSGNTPISSPKRSMIQDSHRLRSGGSTKNKQLAVQRPLSKKLRSSNKSSMKCQPYHSSGKTPISSPKRSATQHSRQVRLGCSTRNNQLAVRQPLLKKPASSSKGSMKCQRSNSLRGRPISSCKRSRTQHSRQVLSSYSSRNNQLAVWQPLFKKPASSTKRSMKCSSRKVCSNSLTICGKQKAQRSLRKGPVNSPKRNVIRPSRLVHSNRLIRNNQLAAQRPLLKKSAGSTKRSPKKPSHQLLSKNLAQYKKQPSHQVLSKTRARYKKQPSRQVFSKTLARYKNQAVKRSLLATKRKMGPSPLEGCQSLCKKRLISTERSTKRPSRQGQSNSFTESEAKLQCWTKTDSRLRVGSLISQRRRVTEEEKARVLDDAKSFKLKNPSVAVVMRAGYVYAGFLMVLPRKFTSNLPKEDIVMTVLDPSGRCWTMKYLFRKIFGALSGGWSSFCLANNLEESDVCVFERLEKDKLQVHIFRVVEEITPLIKIVSSMIKKTSRIGLNTAIQCNEEKEVKE